MAISAARPLPAGERVVAAVHIHDQVLGRADVQGERGGGDAVEPDASAVGGDGEGLRAVAAVDLDGVDAVPALVEVGAVAGVPDHPVVAALAEDLVVAGAAGQHVVAVAAEQQVVAPLAEQGVVARLAEEQVVAAAAGEGVVAGAAEDVRVRQGAVGLVESRLSLPPRPKIWIRLVLATVGCPAQDRHGAAVDQDRPGRVAGDRDGVVLGIADDRQQARGRKNVALTAGKMRASSISGRVAPMAGWRRRDGRRRPRIIRP